MTTWTRSHLIDSRFTAVRRNLAVNPSFEVPNTATYTNLATNPSFDTVSGTLTAYRTNLLTNPNLSAGLGSWTAMGITSTPISGGRLFTAPNSDTQQAVYSGAIAIAAGTPVSAKVTVGVPAGQPPLNFSLLVRDGPATHGVGPVAVATGTQTTLTFVGNAPSYTPAPGTTTRIDVIVTGLVTGNQWVIYDNATVESIALDRPMFSGSSASPDPDMTVAWTGTANASTSVLNGADLAATFGGLRSTQWSRHGTSSVRRPGRITSNDSSVVVASTTGGGGIGYQLQAGKTYTVLAWLRQDQALTGTPYSGGSRQISYVGQVGNAPTVRSTQQANAAGVYEHRVTFTVNNTTDYAQVRLYNGTQAGNGDVWWDDLVIVEGTYTGGYFDGTYHDDPDLTVAWNGTPNASTSTALDTAQNTAIWTNLITNPAGVATGTPWSTNAGIGEFSQGPALGPFTTSARMTRVGTGATRFAITAPHNPSTTYTVRARLRASELLTATSVYMRPDAASSASQSLVATIDVPAGESEWVWTTTTTPTAVSAAGGLTIVVGLGRGVIGATLDAVATLIQGPNEPGFIFNGSTPTQADPPRTFAWDGTPHASTSRMSGELVRGTASPSQLARVRTNLSIDPAGTVVSASGGRRFQNDRYATSGTYTAITGISDHPVGITTAMRHTVTVTAVRKGFNLAHNPDSGTIDLSRQVPVVGGQPLTISCWIRPSRTFDWAIYRRPSDAVGWLAASAAGPTVNCPAGVWTRVTLTYTPPANAISVALLVCQVSGTFEVGDTIDGTGLLIEASSFVGSWFSGATPDTETVINDWTGTPNASTSTQSIYLTYAANGVVPYRSSAWMAGAGAYSARLVPFTVSNDTYLSWGATSWFPWGMTPGRTYVVAATRFIAAALTGTLHVNAGRIVVWVSRNGTTWDVAATGTSSQALNNPAEVTRLTVQVTIPSDATGVAVALYHGGEQGSGDVWWDHVLVDDVTGLPPAQVSTTYFDGSFPWATWRGTPGLSPSIGYRWALP
jgi:hypothetical protein